MASNECEVLKGGCAVGPTRKVETNDGKQNVIGTIGAIVQYQMKPMILSCYHVLVPDGNFQRYDPIRQFRRSPTRHVGTLWREYSFGEGNIDAALALVDPGIPIDSGIRGLLTPTGFATMLDIKRLKTEGITVKKMGIETNLTEGKITHIGMPATVEYPIHTGMELNLNGQLYVKNDQPGELFSDEKDSGSLVISESMGKVLIVGMLVGGQKTGERYSVVTPIELIRSNYQFELL